VLFGSIVGWSRDELEIDASRIGRVRIKPSSVRRFYRSRDNGDVVYLGPSGLSGWQLSPASKAWREDFGHLATDQEGFAVGNFGLPDRAAVEFEISWKKKPDFVLALAVGDDEKSLKQAFRFEVWGNDLVVQRELENEADPAEIQTIASGPGRAHLQVFLDQNLGRCLVFSASGSKLAEINVKAAQPQVHGGVRLDNVRGDVRLERLRIARWTGDLPREVKADQPRVHRADGAIEYGQILRFESASGEFVLRGESGETRVAAARVDSAFLSFPTESQSPAVRVGYHDGIHVGGELAKVSEGALWMTSRAVTGTLRLPLEGLRSIIVLRLDAISDPDGPEPVGTLELDGARLRGQLVDGEAKPGASCLVWRPNGSTGASHLRSGVSGRIVYREPPPPKPAQPRPTQPQGGMRVMINGAAVQQPAARRNNAKGSGQPSLYLLTGDTIPCEVTKIDEEGVTFKTAVSDSGFVPHANIKAVELVRDPQNAPGLTAVKRNRLLTLPRMQRDNPPTHLIRSRNGDYLRGRIIGMDENNLQVEVRLETKTIPRERIVRIIWLHAEDLVSDGSREEPDAVAHPTDTRDGRVQVLRSDGIRLTFVPERFADAALSGSSEVLGSCRVAMKQIDQLLIGSAIEQAAAQLAYQKWKMLNAIDPKFVQAGDSPDEGAGMESSLVGKPAPVFDLELLKGGRFKLAEMRGKVVILDFWATWCGPCLAAMPQVDRAARAFANAGVQLVAVNLEEAPKQIKSMLERHKFDLTVALDRDGAVAAKYQANAIPQTVIIDKEGVVSRVFIGGNAHLEDQIREALQTLLPEAKPAEPAGPAGQ
jgi:thiol-disulfide isomerase/thioredoxin